MKAKLFVVTLLSLALVMPAMAQKKDKKSKKGKSEVVVSDSLKLTSQIDSVSYGLGVLFGGNLKRGGLDSLNLKAMNQGFEESFKGKKTIISAEEANSILNTYAMGLMKIKADKNLKDGQAYLEKNKSEAGIVVLPSGLQYKILTSGTGEKPTLNNKVKVHYHGTLIDGTVFDSSVDRGEPIELSVGGVIDGWKEALQLMPVGSKWRLYIPSNLGYGEQTQQGSPIGPNSALIFDVELISIVTE